jgi:hypothetical protein
VKALLMHRDRDFDPQQALPWNAQALTEDLALETLLRAMAGDDPLLLDVARKALLSGLRNDIATIAYRQAVLKDCLKNPEAVRALYAVAVEALTRKRGNWLGVFSHYVGGILYEATELMQMLVGMLRKLRGIAQEHSGRFESEGFTTLFALMERELSDAYFAGIQKHLTVLGFRRGVLLSAELGEGNAGSHYVLRKTPDKGPNWLARMLGKTPPAYTYSIDPRDEAGARALSELRDRGINLVANALAQSTDHILSFFRMLRTELAFYVGCLNLHNRLMELGEPICFPTPAPVGEHRRCFRGLYDVCLALTMARTVVGNTANADGKSLVIVTGANQGGKSTFLRSIGLAQVMMQCGMFVAAESFAADLCAGLFTHYKREEDATMKHGKLDEELARMSDIADHLAPHAMLLFNESFASTNEREGSEIAGQIVCALLEKSMKVFFVTHLHEFARGMFDREREDALFLRAERQADGTRTFRLVKGEPLETSYGEDLYRQVFAVEAGAP